MNVIAAKKEWQKLYRRFGKEELKKILEEDGKVEMSCHFCNKKYQFSEEELLSLII